MSNREIGPNHNGGPKIDDEGQEEIANAAVNIGLKIVGVTAALASGIVIGVDITDENGTIREFAVEITEIFTKH